MRHELVVVGIHQRLEKKHKFITMTLIKKHGTINLYTSTVRFYYRRVTKMWEV